MTVPHQQPRYGNGTNKHTICAEKPVEVDEKKMFHNIAGKNDSHADMQEKKQRPHRPTNQIERILAVKNTHKILGITFDNRPTWKAHTYN
jgi:hypothetical protein